MFPGGVGATAEGGMIKDNVVEIGLWFHDEDFEKTNDVYNRTKTLSPSWRLRKRPSACA